MTRRPVPDLWTSCGDRAPRAAGHERRHQTAPPPGRRRPGADLRDDGALGRQRLTLNVYGAGWSDRERQQPGDSGRHEPRQTAAIADAELQRALDDPDPLRAIAGLVARWSAAFVLDPDGVTRTKALGSERMARKLRDALPGGQHPLRAAVWGFLRPMLAPRLVDLHRDAFVIEDGPQSTVDLAAHRGESSLDEIVLGEPDADAA